MSSIAPNRAVPLIEGHERPSHLAHHFETPKQQYEAGKLGMWLFLATEVLLFGGLFCAYAVYRANHPEIFIYADRYMDKVLGGINTAILICSSLTMASAVRCAQVGRQRGLIICLVLTLLFACGFLGIKYVEYSHKWKDGLLWGRRFAPTYVPGEEDHAAAAAGTEAGAPGQQDVGHAPVRKRPPNVQIFFGIYFTMTGLHALHVLAGMSVISWILVRSIRGQFGPAYFTPVDLTGLYWHLVDLIWIYLFPLLYLIH
jgi:cytochrome c oxidase subunit 3